MTIAPPPRQARPFLWSHFAFAALELLLTLAVGAALWHLAEPLAVPGLADGLGFRFADAFASGLRGHDAAKVARTVWLMENAGAVLLWMALAGWLGLVVARRGRPGSGPILVGLWAVSGVLLTPYGISSFTFWVVASASTKLALARILFSRSRDSLAAPSGAPHCFPAAAIWPLLCLALGLGALWIADFSARGPLATRFIGVSQFDAAWLATFIYCMSCRYAAACTRAVVASAHLLQSIARKPGRIHILAFAFAIVSAALLLGWLGRPMEARILGVGGLGKPHITGEWVRWPALLALAWLGYRRVEWASRLRHSGHSGMAVAVFGGFAAMVFALSQDNGPAMVLCLSVVLIAGTVTVPQGPVGALRPHVHALMLVTLVAAAWWFALTQHAPALSERASLREAMRVAPFSAASDQFAQVLWLLDATPVGGFGLGRVPWCGALAHAELLPCTWPGRGVGPAFPSDLAAAGLIAVWGAAGCAAAIAGLCALCLCALRSVTWGFGPAPAGYGLLRAWMVSVFGIAALIQITICVGGSIGWLPLAGMNLPLLANAGQSIVASAIWLGWASATKLGNA